MEKGEGSGKNKSDQMWGGKGCVERCMELGGILGTS